MRVNPTAFGMNGLNDSVFVFVSVPAVKLYSDTALFSATVTNPPGTGTFTLSFLNKTSNTLQNRLTTYPDSLRLRIKTSGGVPNGLYTVRVQGNGPNGTPVHERFININVGFVGIINNSKIPDGFNLYQNYPNPFNPATVINFDLPVNGKVSLKVFDILGKEVITLLDKNMASGKFDIDFDASEFTSGLYFYKLTVVPDDPSTGEFTAIKKMLLIK